MIAFVLTFAVIALLAVGVVALVAVQARREGREVLTPQGGQLLHSARERTGDLAGAARGRAVGARTTPPADEAVHEAAGQDRRPRTASDAPQPTTSSTPTAVEARATP